MTNKICIVCGMNYSKRDKDSRIQWNARKFCSRICKNVAQKGSLRSEETKKKMSIAGKNSPEDVWKQIDKHSECIWFMWTCWEWVGGLNSTGYGVMGIDYKKYLAHRIVYKEIYGEIMNGLFVLHKCNNPKCCNPNHLYLGTQTDNVEQMFKEGRANTACGERTGAAKLTEKDVLEIRRLYLTGDYSQRDLGKMFEVDHKVICNIINRNAWRHI